MQTRLGPLRLKFSSHGLCGLAIGGDCRLPISTGALARQLQRYAAGKSVSFRVRLDLSTGTPFQQKVWRALLKIPRGETRSYLWVARHIGKPRAVRAVGAACGANPVGIIVPCHRVVASDGSLGGYTGGLKWKKRLLKLEGAL